MRQSLCILNLVLVDVKQAAMGIILGGQGSLTEYLVSYEPRVVCTVHSII